MAELQVEGVITDILSVEKGTTKAGKEWSKQLFLLKKDSEYNNLYCFEVFGDEKVANLTKYNKVGDHVKVVFNVNTNELKGRYFTSLSAWRIEKLDTAQVEAQETAQEESEEDGQGLPF